MKLAAIIALAGCSEPAVCSLDNAIQGAVTEPATSCGDIEVGANEPAYREAHDCAANALQRQQPFTVRWQTDLIDYGENLHAIVATEEDGRYVVRQLDAGTMFDFSGYSVARTCMPIEDLGACPDITGLLCFECHDAPTQVCP